MVNVCKLIITYINLSISDEINDASSQTEDGVINLVKLEVSSLELRYP